MTPETTHEEVSREIDDGNRRKPAPGFVRRHPVLTILGTAGAGLIGGFELAAGVLIGAGVAAAVRARDDHRRETEAHGVRARARQLLARMPPELQRRGRAVVQAARGRLQPSE